MSTTQIVIAALGAIGVGVLAITTGPSGVVGFIQAIPILEGWFQSLMAAWMTSQTNSTLSAIADAAAFAGRAQTDDDRYQAAQKWRDALSRPRQLP